MHCVLSDIFRITNIYTRAKIRIISKDVNVGAIGAANHITRADLARQFRISIITLGRMKRNVYGDDLNLDRQLISNESGPELEAALEEENKNRASRSNIYIDIKVLVTEVCSVLRL